MELVCSKVGSGEGTTAHAVMETTSNTVTALTLGKTITEVEDDSGSVGKAMDKLSIEEPDNAKSIPVADAIKQTFSQESSEIEGSVSGDGTSIAKTNEAGDCSNQEHNKLNELKIEASSNAVVLSNVGIKEGASTSDGIITITAEGTAVSDGVATKSSKENDLVSKQEEIIKLENSSAQVPKAENKLLDEEPVNADSSTVVDDINKTRTHGVNGARSKGGKKKSKGGGKKKKKGGAKKKKKSKRRRR